MPNLSWPSLLAGRLLAAAPACPTAVLNEGISGNQLTQGSASGGFGGPPGLQRADRDVFSQPGVRLVIVLLGINDIGAGGVSASRVIAGYRLLVAAAHAHHLRILAGTLTPAGDPAQRSVYAIPYGGALQVQRRARVNAWIRTAGVFDGVIDFADALASPGDPNQLSAAYDSGDHLHPNSAGYQRMAATVDLASLRSCAT